MLALLGSFLFLGRSLNSLLQNEFPQARLIAVSFDQEAVVTPDFQTVKSAQSALMVEGPFETESAAGWMYDTTRFFPYNNLIDSRKQEAAAAAGLGILAAALQNQPALHKVLNDGGSLDPDAGIELSPLGNRAISAAQASCSGIEAKFWSDDSLRVSIRLQSGLDFVSPSGERFHFDFKRGPGKSQIAPIKFTDNADKHLLPSTVALLKRQSVRIGQGWHTLSLEDMCLLVTKITNITLVADRRFDNRSLRVWSADSEVKANEFAEAACAALNLYERKSLTCNFLAISPGDPRQFLLKKARAKAIRAAEPLIKLASSLGLLPAGFDSKSLGSSTTLGSLSPEQLAELQQNLDLRNPKNLAQFNDILTDASSGNFVISPTVSAWSVLSSPNQHASVGGTIVDFGR